MCCIKNDYLQKIILSVLFWNYDKKIEEVLYMYVPKGMQKTCMYQIMHIPKQFNILTQFIQIFIYTNNMYQCVPQDGAFIFLLGRR